MMINPQAQILLVRHNYGQRRWSFPGGAVESGEAVLDATLREVREELGIEVQIQCLIGLYRTTGKNKPDRDVYVFLAEVPASMNFNPDPTEIAEILWVDPKNLPSPLTNEVAHAVRDHLEQQHGRVRQVQRQN
ncbi:hypothetical protein DC3_33800 [Deinococcus cellulosilyticus NBRC 106333 = KACC 11606]|uniref:Nudix hydrolase domain-containing protein n=2 Tax=Deinococcus cellulosilyticus TaxID=401558 RepID=A0A511N4I7_DEIC1|nr:hypothetical protein DC3_33800 [Deinococcus cellulosilyticus NBRC 106333 = KACC 11606]